MSTSRCSQVFFLFFAREQRQWFDKRSNCIFSIACIAIQTIHVQFLTEHKSLCSHNGQRGLWRQSTGGNTQVMLLQPAQSLTQAEQCLLIAANALHSYGWQKNNIPYQQVKPLTAQPTMKTLSPLVNRLWWFCTESPTSVIDQIVHTMSMYLFKCHIGLVCQCM